MFYAFAIKWRELLQESNDEVYYLVCYFRFIFPSLVNFRSALNAPPHPSRNTRTLRHIRNAQTDIDSPRVSRYALGCVSTVYLNAYWVGLEKCWDSHSIPNQRANTGNVLQSSNWKPSMLNLLFSQARQLDLLLVGGCPTQMFAKTQGWNTDVTVSLSRETISCGWWERWHTSVDCDIHSFIAQLAPYSPKKERKVAITQVFRMKSTRKKEGGGN